MELYHFSEQPDIVRFEPRVMKSRTDESAKVWAIDSYHAPHYYFPRECPRVCVWPGEETTEQDDDLFFGMSNTKRMIAIESAWYERVKTGFIYKYSFKPDCFELHDSNAGYFISTQTVTPFAVERIDDLIGFILQAGIELRVTSSLMPLRTRIISSTVNFSMIRLRNAIQS